MKTELLRSTLDSIQSELLPSSGIIGSAKANSKPTGQQLSETAAGKLPSVHEAAAMGQDPDRLDRAIVELLPLSVRSICRRVEREYIDPKYGFDVEFHGYVIEGQISEEDRDYACLIVNQYMDAPPENAIKSELARLRASTKARAEADDDLAMTFQVMAEECAEHPADVVVWALRGWARSETFYPSMAELRDRLQIASRGRRTLLAAIRR